jgi:hypothetical protein
MFEVTKYEHPEIFVTCRRTGETYKFAVDTIGTRDHEPAGAMHDARRAALSYLAWFSAAREKMVAQTAREHR